MNATPLIKVKRLRKGSRLGVIAPSEPVDTAAFDRGMARLREMGFTMVEANAVRERMGHLAGEDQRRAGDIMRMFTDPAIEGILCAAGGANSARLLPLLDYEMIKANPKALVGMSDPTSLLCAIYAKTGLMTFHGPVVQYDFGRDEPSRVTYDSFITALMDGRGQTIPAEVLRSGHCRGPLVGGNLSTVQQLLGTQYEPSWDGAILFWEDVFEQVHSLDAKLTHFRNAGVFDRIAGMVVGELIGCDEEDYPGTAPIEDILLQLTAGQNFPILMGGKFGHGADKLTISLGAPGVIDTHAGAFISLGTGCE